VHREPGERGYASVERMPASSRLNPLHAPAELGFVLDELDAR
jgi:hypothetical protein